MTLTFEMREGMQKQGLNDLCNYVKLKLGTKINMVEIGAYCGASGKIFAENFDEGVINSVDPWTKYIEDCSIYDINKQELELKEAELIFDSMIKHYKNIFKNKTSSVEYNKNIPDESLDFIYIDGNHQYSSVLEDIKLWYPKVKPGGIFAGHDYGWETIRRACFDYFAKQPSGVFCDSSWIYHK